MSSRPPAYARKTDRNHAAIRNALRAAGWQVTDFSGVGHGVPDLCAARDTFRCWVEVKVEGEGLTVAERRFFDNAPGCKIVATAPQDAIDQLQALWMLDGGR